MGILHQGTGLGGGGVGHGLTVAAIALSLALTSPLYAQESENEVAAPSDTAARILFQEGLSQYGEGNYEDALSRFLQAHELSGRDPLLYNIFLCYERMADFDNAVSYLERYLPTITDPEERAMQERKLTNLRERQAQQTAEREELIASVESPLPVGTITSFVASGAGLLVFALTGGLAMAEDADLSKRCATGCPEVAVDGLRTMMLVADIGLALFVAAGIAGGIFAALELGGDEDDSGDGASAAVYPWFSPEGGGLGASLQF